MISYTEDHVPPLVAGTSYVELSANYSNASARVGPTSTYVSFGAGCAWGNPLGAVVSNAAEGVIGHW